MFTNMAIRLNVDPIRKARGMTLEELADKIGMSAAHLSRISTGVRRFNSDNLEDLMTALDCSLIELVYDTDDNDKLAVISKLARLTADEISVASDHLDFLIHKQRSGEQ